MTRENKLALIVGFSLILLVGVLISDHLSKAGQDHLGEPVAGVPVRSVSGLEEAPAAVLALPDPPAWVLPEEVAQQQVAVHEPEPVGGMAGGLTEALAPMGSGVLAAADSEPAVIRQGSLASSLQSVVSQAQSSMDSAVGDLRDRVGDFLSSGAGRDSAVLAQTGDLGRPVLRAAPEPVVDEFAARLAARSGGLLAQEREYVVKSGDSLSKIAAQMLGDRSRWQEILKVNADRVTDPAMIREGMRLRLPVTGSPSRIAAAPEPKAPRASEPKAPARGAKTYVVRKGDTLSEIAQRTLGSVTYQRDIMQANGLDDPNKIFVGMELRIPGRG